MLGERGEPLVLVRPQADGEDAAGAVPGAADVDAVGVQPPPATPGSARRTGAGTATAPGRSPCWWRATGSRRRRRWPAPDGRRRPRSPRAPGTPARRRGTAPPGRHRRTATSVASPFTAPSPPARQPSCQRWGTMSAVQVVRTPDERFAELPGFPFAPRYADAARRAAHALRRRGAGRRRDRPAAARPADLVLPVPHGRGPARGARAARRRTRPRRVRPLGQAGGAHGPLGTQPRRLDGPVRRRARVCATSPSSSRTGAAPSGSACSAPGPGWSAASWPPTPRCTPPRPAWPGGWPGPATPTRTGPSPWRRRCSTTSA